MMSYLKLSIVLLNLMILVDKASAQTQNAKALNQQNSIEFAKREADSLQKVLNLNINQAKQLDSIERVFLEKRVNIPKQITSSERTARLRELETWHTNQLKEIFSAAQYKKYVELVEERKRKTIEKQKSFNQQYKKV